MNKEEIMWCYKCGKKITEKSAYYIKQTVSTDSSIESRLRPVCKQHYMEIKNNG